MLDEILKGLQSATGVFNFTLGSALMISVALALMVLAIKLAPSESSVGQTGRPRSTRP